MLNVCVVGCGDMGTAHAMAWKNRPDARVVAVCDPDEQRCQKLATACDARGYADYCECLAHPGIQAVSVCTPVCYHAEVACLSARQGYHVLVEKPIALNLEQADRMIREAEENKVLLSVSFQYRAFARNVKYRELFRTGEFGGPVFFRFADIREVRPKLAMHRQSMNGGPMVDMAGHFFDLVRYFTGQEPEGVFARGHVFGRGKARVATVTDLAIDAATVEVSFAEGHTLTAFVNWGMPEGFEGIVDEMLIGPNLCARPAGEGIELIRGSEKEICALNDSPVGPSARIDGLVKAMRGESPLEVTGRDGRIALQTSLAALESISTGSVVRLNV